MPVLNSLESRNLVPFDGSHPGSSPSRHFPMIAVVVILASVGLLLLLLLVVHMLLQRSSDYIDVQPFNTG